MNEKIIAGAVLNVLALEDSVPDFEIIREQLIDAGYHLNISRVDKEKEFESSIRGNQYDIILADFKLPGFDAFGALRLCNAICPDVPFICVSGAIGEETAIELIKQGAVDYVLKDRLARLPSAIKRALDEAKENEAKLMAEEALRKTEQQTRTFLDATSDMAFLKDASFRHIIANSALCTFYGKTESEVLGKTDFDLMDEKAAAECRKTDEKTLRSNELVITEEVVGGRYYETRKFPVDLAEGKNGVGAYIRDITERKLAEEVIVRAAQEWRTTFDATVDMIWLLDSEQRILRANKPSERFFKHSCGELVGMHCWEIVHGTTEPIPACPLLQVKKSLCRETMELRLGDGWFIITVDPILNATGQYDGAVHMVRDITGRKRVEEKLKENAGLLRIAGEKAKLGGWSVDLKNNLCTWSDETAAIHERPAGYAPVVEEGISYYAPEWREKITKVFTQCAQNGIPYDEEMEIITANGKRVWVRTMGEPVKDEAGKIIKVQGAFQDIAERKRAEELLLLKNIVFDESIAANSIADIDGVITEANYAFLQIWGYSSKDEVVGHPISYFLNDPGEAVAIVNALNGKGEWQGDFTAKKKDGSTFIAHSMATVIRDKNGKVTGYQSSVMDITEHKLAEIQREVALEEIRKFNEKLEQRIKERTVELQENIDLLKETNSAFVGRELKMAELKERIAELEKKT